ncbi:MAG TPA: hypothetical protein VF544_18825 [Pyrinomonadaceae bacterium]|jgi:hypothetical protein
MRRAFSLLTVAAALLLLGPILGGHQARASGLWGDLRPGPYHVGYRTIYAYDLSRPSIKVESARANGLGQRGRQMQINVWYPAQMSRGSRPMLFEEYAELLLQEVDFAPLTSAQKRLSAEKFLESPVELGGDAAQIRPLLPALMKMETAATKDARPAGGHFPLVIFPAYKSPAVQSIMCEYLASHGFVVASTGLKGTLDSDPEISVAGLETHSADLQFVMGRLRALPFVDGEKLALMGVGFIASGCLALQTRNPEVDALISLDGGIPSAFEDRMLKRTPYWDVSAIRVPLLAIHAPHPNIDPAFFDQYKYSIRHIVHFPRMSEFYFLNYGMIERFVPGIIGKPPGDTKLGYEWASRYCLHFLKAYLKGEAESLAFLRNEPARNLVPEGLRLSMTLKKGLAPPPTMPEIKVMIREKGFESVVALYNQLRREDPQPFSQEKLADLSSWLAYRRDPEWKARRALALIRVESYPESARAHFALAGVAAQLAEKELARKHYREALRLLESDPDPVLDYALRKRIEQSARQGLKSLES